MLCELRVENLLLIERAELVLAPGLNVLTGETGAGKTVLAHALDLLMGGPARPARAGIVRPGAEEAYVEGVFSVPARLRDEITRVLPENANGKQQLDELILARRVFADGRTRAYLNSRAVTIADLRELGALLISFYGQHEHRKLMLAGAQLRMLDRVCGASQAKRLEACANAYGETSRLERELERLHELSRNRERELELLEHEISEIDSLAPDQEEHEVLLRRRDRLRSRDALHRAAGMAAETLEPESYDAPAVTQLIGTAMTSLEAVRSADAELDGLLERCSALAIEAHELAAELRAYCDGIEEDDESLEQTEERLAQLDRVTRKHGGTIGAVLEHAESARERRDELLGATVAEQATVDSLQAVQSALAKHVEQLRRAREAAAGGFAQAVREQLAALGMQQATFEIALTPTAASAVGGDKAEFMIAANPGLASTPLRETASGGELSRVMLALICASDDDGETLVFDEIDAGIGGHTARAVGERLQRIGRGRQVLCITHLPQIASLAERHFTVAKDASDDSTLTSVVQLSEQQVLTELVRMLGSEVKDVGARRHARELRRAA